MLHQLNFSNTDTPYNPDIAEDKLVVIEHKNRTFVVKIFNYQHHDLFDGKICYLNENFAPPYVMLNRHNIKGVLCTPKEFVAKHGEELLHIANMTRIDSLFYLINIHYTATVKERLKIEQENCNKIRQIKDDYLLKLKLLQFAWH